MHISSLIRITRTGKKLGEDHIGVVLAQARNLEKIILECYFMDLYSKMNVRLPITYKVIKMKTNFNCIKIVDISVVRNFAIGNILT
jgi:hypothetical protein